MNNIEEKTILIVEDYEVFAEFLKILIEERLSIDKKKLIKRKKYKIEIAVDRPDAQRKINKDTVLIILDLGLVQDGVGVNNEYDEGMKLLCELLKQNIPIIVVSAIPEVSFISRANDYEIPQEIIDTIPFLKKPFQEEVIYNELIRILEGG
ncbi:hypothetical protein ACFL47_04560 [Candidatus Latescibacterota bacterium]